MKLLSICALALLAISRAALAEPPAPPASVSDRAQSAFGVLVPSKTLLPDLVKINSLQPDPVTNKFPVYQVQYAVSLSGTIIQLGYQMNCPPQFYFDEHQDTYCPQNSGQFILLRTLDASTPAVRNALASVGLAVADGHWQNLRDQTDTATDTNAGMGWANYCSVVITAP